MISRPSSDDLKPLQIYAATHQRRRDMGDTVWRIAPFSKNKSDSLNPLDQISPQTLNADARRLAQHICPPEQQRKLSDPFWYEAAQDILSAFIAYIAAETVGKQRSLTSIATHSALPRNESRRILNEIKAFATTQLTRRNMSLLTYYEDDDVIESVSLIVKWRGFLIAMWRWVGAEECGRR